MDSCTPRRLQADSVRFTDAESTLIDNFCVDTIYSNAVNDHRQGKKYFTLLEVKAMPQSSTTTIRYQIDSGATWNVLPHRYLKQLGHPPLEPSTSIMNMYNNNRVQPQGILHLECLKNGLNPTLPFDVIDRMQFTNKPPLLCGSDSEKLQLLSITADEVNSIQNETLSEAVLRNKYHDVFHGLGKIGDPVHIQLDPDIHPVKAGLCRYPVNKVPAISNRIQEMIDEGTLTMFGEHELNREISSSTEENWREILRI